MILSFQRIAIVNRGEPAMRLIHAVNEYNAQFGTDLKTIALHTTPDSKSLFVRKADEAITIGDATFIDSRDGQRKSSYLDYNRLKNALKNSRAQAVWVGWGFVAEHPEFAELCHEIGITFIGPTAPVMRKLGDKIESKRVAEAAGVPVSAWSNGPVQTLDEAKIWAEKIGLPLMVKATAGGGGRGIRKVTRMEDLPEAFQSARSEALKGFGDDTVFMEKMISNARHIEVQIIADTHGNVWAAGVRDCSVQRRNQKVIEEAPCPSLTALQEKNIKDAAIRLAKTAGYINAGTVECLFQPESGCFYFMEMNTRLQVEHPVTEMTTGIDLVKLQLHVASGGTLQGESPQTSGCAIEVRLNAEDPDNGFAPAPGKATHFRLPNGPGIRIDTGIEEGDSIAPDFDSMVAKIIAFGKTRTEAIARLKRALSECSVVIDGGSSNKSFLLELLSQPDFVESKLDIGWLDRLNASRAEQKTERKHSAVALAAAAIASYKIAANGERALFLTGSARGRPQVDEKFQRQVELQYRGQSYKIGVSRTAPEFWTLECDDAKISVRCGEFGDYDGWIEASGNRHRLLVVPHGVTFLVEVDGVPHRISSDDGGLVRAPASSIVLTSLVKPGDVVSEGDRLILLEAMKMETSVLSPCAGRVKAVLARSNTQVDAGTPLIALEPLEQNGAIETSNRIKLDQLQNQKIPKKAKTRQNILNNLENALLGYDIAPQSLLSQIQAHPFDSAFANRENAILKTTASLINLYGKQAFNGRDIIKGSEEWLLTYLRSPETEGDGLPDSFTAHLKSVLTRYGINNLVRTKQLEEALVLVHKTYKRMDGISQCLTLILEQRIEWSLSHPNSENDEFREIMDALVLACRDRFSLLSEMATQTRHQIFNQSIFLADYTRAMTSVDSQLENLAHATSENRDAWIECLLESPYPIAAHLSNKLAKDSHIDAKTTLEILLRQAYAESNFKIVNKADSKTTPQTNSFAFTFVEASDTNKANALNVLATHCTLENITHCWNAALQHGFQN